MSHYPSMSELNAMPEGHREALLRADESNVGGYNDNKQEALLRADDNKTGGYNDNKQKPRPPAFKDPARVCACRSACRPGKVAGEQCEEPLAPDSYWYCAPCKGHVRTGA